MHEDTYYVTGRFVILVTFWLFMLCSTAVAIAWIVAGSY